MGAGGHHLGLLADAAQERYGTAETLLFEGRWHRADELRARSHRVAGGLLELGIAPGDRVAVVMSNCPEVGITYTALWRVGAVVTPVIFLVSASELRHVLTDSAAVAVVTTPEFLPKVEEAAAGLAGLRHVVVVGSAGAEGQRRVDFAALERAAPGDLVPRADDDLAALMYTGGTTGRAKGVMLRHENLWQSGHSSHEAGYVPGTQRTLVPLPLSHAFGLIVTVVGMHSPEPPVSVLMRWFDPAGWVSLAAEHRVARSPVVPSMLAMLLQQPLEQHDLSELRFLTVGAAPLARELLEAVERRLPGVEVHEGYGCTESAAVISTNTAYARRVGTVGRPIPGCEVRIVDDAGADVPPGADGEILARSAGVMAGYWNSPEETAATLRGGWLHTGDIGHLDADGFLSVVDRKKDLIIRSGVNVYPRDVEDALAQHPDVTMAGVVGRPDPVRGEEVVAFVSLRAGAATGPAELVAFAKERLAAVKYPREVHLLPALPLTPVGKLDRKRLRGMLPELEG